MKTYRRGKYRVEIARDGAIQVRRGDWLSKYSAAIHNNFYEVYEYGRINCLGRMEYILDVDKIYAGETIYHIPTWQAVPREIDMEAEDIIVGPSPPSMTEGEKRRLTRQMLQREFDIPGERLKLLNQIIDYVGYVDNALALGELAGLVSEGSFLATGAGPVSMVSALLFPVGAFISLANTWESGERQFAMRAIAYAGTAWAFDDPPPEPSPEILRRVELLDYSSKVGDYKKAWQDAVRETYNKLEEERSSREISRKSLQLYLQALGDGSQETLCLALLAGFESEFRGVSLDAWRSEYAIPYPL